MTHPDLAEPNRTRHTKTDERALSMQIMHSGLKANATAHEGTACSVLLWSVLHAC